MEEKLEDSIVKLNDLSNISTNFKKNKCPIDLKKNKEYIKLDCNIGSMKQGFEECIKKPLNEYPLMLVGLFYSVVFYMLLILYFADKEGDKSLLIYLILIYFFGIFIQSTIVPIPTTYKTKEDLDKKMNELLNSGVKIFFKNTNKKLKTVYPANYTTDITGVVNIPKKINYLRLKGLIIYGDKNYSEFKKDFKDINKTGLINIKRTFSLFSNNNEIKFPKNEIYDLNSSGSYSINNSMRIGCIFMLQWLVALLDTFNDDKTCIDVYLVKLISKEQKNLPLTQFTVHETSYKVVNNIYMSLENDENDKFKKDYEQFHQKKKEEKERKREREKEKRDNTEELSEFESNNYDMRIYRYYNDVYLDLYCHENKKNSYKKQKIYLGKYDENIEEDVEDEDEQVIYTPKGCDINIVVKNFAYNYTIKIGTKFTKDFNYYSK